jgi:hypothetical protein
MIAPREVNGSKINAAVAEVTRELSPWVRHIRYDIALDWSGEWGVFFRVLLSDEASKQPNLLNIGSRVIEKCRRSSIYRTSDFFQTSIFGANRSKPNSTTRSGLQLRNGFRRRSA